MDSFYRKVYPKSWFLIKNNLSLLFFGMFASILGFHEIKTLFNLNGATPDLLGSVLESWTIIIKALAVTNLTWASFPALLNIIAMFILFAIILIMAVSSQGALVYSTIQKQKFKSSSKPSKFFEAFQIGVHKFWPLFGLNILNTLIGYFFVISVVQPLLSFLNNGNQETAVIYLLLAIIVFFILLPIIVIISFVTRYGAAYIVIKNEKLIPAFINGWNLFKINWLITVENIIVLLVITFLFYLALLTVSVFVFTPFLILAYFMSSFSIIFWLLIALGSLITIVLFIVATSFFGAYYNIIWANIFLELTSKGKSHSKIHRIARKHLPRLAR